MRLTSDVRLLGGLRWILCDEGQAMDVDPAFHVTNVVYESNRSTVRNAVEVRTGRSVTLKSQRRRPVSIIDRYACQRAVASSALALDVTPATHLVMIDDVPTLVMDHIDGEPLSTHLARRV